MWWYAKWSKSSIKIRSKTSFSLLMYFFSRLADTCYYMEIISWIYYFCGRQNQTLEKINGWFDFQVLYLHWGFADGQQCNFWVLFTIYIATQINTSSPWCFSNILTVHKTKFYPLVVLSKVLYLVKKIISWNLIKEKGARNVSLESFKPLALSWSSSATKHSCAL